MKNYSAVILCSVLALTACSSIKKTLGAGKGAPDEFAVVERAPLTMPPNFDLVPPQPGAARPQDEAVATSAKGLVLGSQSSAQKAPTGSAAEQALLNKAGATEDDSAIRQQLAVPDNDKQKETVAQQLGITESDSKGKALNPTEEAARLKNKNVKTTPIAPKADAKNAQ